jgi:hypothetical protein
VTKILLPILLFCSLNLFAQNGQKKDTVYYLIDTAKTLKSDRIFSINPYPRFVIYSIYCPCIPSNIGFSFYYSTIKGLPDTSLKEPVYINKKDIKRIKFIPLYKLIELACKEQDYITINHEIYFVQHLPNGKYTKRKVQFQHPFHPDE